MEEKIIKQRDLYDRRNGIERRSEIDLSADERRFFKERRYNLYEKRTDWTRDTQWASIYVDLLR